MKILHFKPYCLLKLYFIVSILSVNLVYGQGNKKAIHDLKMKAEESYLTSDFSKALSY
ncbi:MAG: hypothetical protein JKY33_08090, partial [Bacteroidia bacterium]|nr:hypothetical protein [Bacteroidia bacterium]